MKIITLDDFIDTYFKILQRGKGFFFSKFTLNKEKRTKSAFNSTAFISSNFWSIPMVRKRWNSLISGDKDVDYIEYLIQTFLKNKSNLRLLSLGSGTSNDEIKLAKHTSIFKEVICIDIADNLLQIGAKKASEEKVGNIKFITKNIDKFEFKENEFVVGENWYLKHDYNLSTHPHSKGKVEGQIDFILLSKYGILIIEVKGGGLRVDDQDNYFSFNKANPGGYKTQNPFNQAKEYTHTLKELIDEGVFIYRAIVLPHEAGFQLRGPQLEGYKNLLFSKKDFENLKGGEDDKAINKLFYDFILNLAKTSRSKILRELNPSWSNEKINKKIFEKYPELSSKKIKSLKSQLFPAQSSYGYNPERINSEIILKENYETLKGLKRNRKVIIQGAPGTGKTVIAKKFLAENILMQQKGIYYCANKLIKSKIEHAIIRDYGIDNSLIKFKVYHENAINENVSNEIDFVIFDEAQEYFNKGLFELIEKFEQKMEHPKLLVLYDPKQTIIYNFSDISFYTDFYIENSFTHYLFDETYRCGQNKNIITISNNILHSKKTKEDKIKQEVVGKASDVAVKLIDKKKNKQLRFPFGKKKSLQRR